MMQDPKNASNMIMNITRCNDDSCYGNGAYGFEQLSPPSDFFNVSTPDNARAGYDNSVRRKWFKDAFEDFQGFEVLQYACSGMLLFSFLLREIFNLKRNEGVNRLPITSQLKMDIFSSLACIAIYFFIAKMHTWEFLEAGKKPKDVLDFMVAAALIMTWSRFFMLFLVVPGLSSMIQTLAQMFADVVPFLCIMVSYLIFGTQFFSTLYQDINPDYFGSIFGSFVTTFDLALGVFGYDGYGQQHELIFTAILLVNVFVIGILLINFLIGILCSTYGELLDSGSFKYK